MTTLKKGDLIKEKNGHTCKVLGVCGDVVHLSYSNDHNAHNYTKTEVQLKEEGFTWDTPAWNPLIGEPYWYIDERGDVYDPVWENVTIDQARRDFLGIYQTRELAEAASLEIKSKLK